VKNARLAILLPSAWRGGILRYAFALARLVASRDWPGIGRIGVVIGLPGDGPYDWRTLDRQAAECNLLSLRRMEWRTWPTSLIKKVYPFVEISRSIEPEVALPRDFRNNFLDCDAWIIFSSSLEGYVFPVRPYAVYCDDIIPRYVPQIFDDPTGAEAPERWNQQLRTFLGWRAARCVFATTPETLSDVVSYAGVPSIRADLVPILAETPKKPDPSIPSLQPTGAPSIVLITNLSPHKNNVLGVEILRKYYEEQAGTLPLKLIGVQTQELNPQTQTSHPGARAFSLAPSVLQRTQFLGEVSDDAYIDLIRNAAVVWHNVIMDNGTLVAFDAARYGRQFVSTDYPQMRYLCARYGIDAIWYKPDDTQSGAVALKLAERRFEAGELPSHQLRTDTDEERATAYGSILRKLLASPSK
jgi:glycosyltransferase involved in cell wall biosynthesis